MEQARGETLRGLHDGGPSTMRGPRVGDEPIRPPPALLAVAAAMVAASALPLFASGKRAGAHART